MRDEKNADSSRMLSYSSLILHPFLSVDSYLKTLCVSFGDEGLIA